MSMQAHTLELPINPNGSEAEVSPSVVDHVRCFAKHRSVYGFAEAVFAFIQTSKTRVTEPMSALLGV